MHQICVWLTGAEHADAVERLCTRHASLKHVGGQAAQAELQQRANSAMAQARTAASDREAALTASLEDQRTEFQVRTWGCIPRSGPSS